jgi:hypothetical protein
VTAYTLHGDCVERGDGARIPMDEGNQDYLAYLAWVDAGNTPNDPPPPAVSVPTSVTMRQARLALLGAGALDAVTSAIDALQGQQGDAARIEWEFAATVERNSPIVAMLAAAVGLDDAALDDLFTVAAAL